MAILIGDIKFPTTYDRYTKPAAEDTKPAAEDTKPIVKPTYDAERYKPAAVDTIERYTDPAEPTPGVTTDKIPADTVIPYQEPTPSHARTVDRVLDTITKPHMTETEKEPRTWRNLLIGTVAAAALLWAVS